MKNAENHPQYTGQNQRVGQNGFEQGPPPAFHSHEPFHRHHTQKIDQCDHNRCGIGCVFQSFCPHHSPGDCEPEIGVEADASLKHRSETPCIHGIRFLNHQSQKGHRENCGYHRNGHTPRRQLSQLRTAHACKQ